MILQIILAAILIAVSFVLILLVVRLVLGSVHPGALIEKWRLQRHVARVRLGDRYLDQGEVDKALLRYQEALCPWPARTAAVADAVKRHHTGLLSRLLAVADQVQGAGLRLMSLARADRLLQDREAMQRRYLAARLAKKSTRDLERALRTNAHELRAALASLAVEITAARRPERRH